MQNEAPHAQQRPAFALPAVLLLSSGILILLVALMTIVELERTTSKARAGAYQADLAVESGFEEAKMILAGATASDSFAVGVIPFAVEYDDNDDGTISSEEDGRLSTARGERGRPYLYAIQGEVSGGDASFRMTPLFATHQGPASQRINQDGMLPLPSDPGISLNEVDSMDSHTAVRGTPHLQAPVTAWRTIRDEGGKPIARYSYWVEDTQGYLDGELAGGNQRKGGNHARANEYWEEQAGAWNPEVASLVSSYIEKGGKVPLWPAPGINPSFVKEEGVAASAENSPLSEVAIYTMDQSKKGVFDETEFDNKVRGLSPIAPTPASLLALSGVQAPLERVPDGIDRGRMVLGTGKSEIEPRWLEENFVTGNKSWEEFALIPFVPGIGPAMMGTPRLNLNKKVESLVGVSSSGNSDVQSTVVGEISQHIADALPNFASARRGGFGDWEVGSGQDQAYLNTIAASIIDYADVDETPTVGKTSYRGIDSHPLISEYLITHTLGSFETRSGAKYLTIEVETFAELWNMSNHPIVGSFELAYINPYVFEALGNPEVDFMSPLENTTASSKESWTSHSLKRNETDGHWYTNPTQVILPSNGYTLVSTGLIIYHLLVAPDGSFFPLPIELSIAEVANYRLKWNGVLCDRSGGGLELTTMLLPNKVGSKQITKGLICGTWGAFENYYSGMYDVRHSWWAGLDNDEGVVSENSFPQNYNPGRRTVRYAIATKRSGSEDLLHGRMLVSEWPDGGHNSDFEVKTFHKRSDGKADRLLRPDDVELYTGDIEPESVKAPFFVSNLGRFFSETELGNIYDPIMWRSSSNPKDTKEIWIRSSIDRSRNNEVPEVEVVAKKATVVGGGNTLRIGRPEHSRFNKEGTRASHLLDLFHCGEPLASNSVDRTGPKRRVEGHVNVNTAPREVLRALAAGILVSDPEISLESSSFDTSRTFAPRKSGRFKDISATDAMGGDRSSSDEAGSIADAIIAGRPFVSRSQIANLIYPKTVSAANLKGKPVFGNKLNHNPGISLQISDRATEEVFARVYNSTTVRSRNFRIHVVGQALEQTPSGKIRVKATRKKSYRVFVDPGEQKSEVGDFDPKQVSVLTSYESNL